MKTPEALYEYLQEKHAGKLEFTEAEVGQPWVTASAEGFEALAKLLRDDPELRFDTLMCLSGVDYPDEEELGVTYHLHSTSFGHSLVLKVRVPAEKPAVPSVEQIWKTADWHEREAWDLLGIRFESHPNLKRILTPEDWEGHPLRKNYQPQETYQKMTTRP